MLEVRLISDPDAIDSVLQHPSVYAKLRHDAREPGYIEHPLASYWGAYADDALVGVFLAVRFSRWEVEAHVGILPHAVKHGRALSRLFLTRVFEDSDVERVTAYILSTLPSAGNLCLKLGFSREGCRRNAVRVDGRLADVLVYGLTRTDWCSTCAAT